MFRLSIVDDLASSKATLQKVLVDLYLRRVFGDIQENEGLWKHRKILRYFQDAFSFAVEIRRVANQIKIRCVYLRARAFLGYQILRDCVERKPIRLESILNDRGRSGDECDCRNGRKDQRVAQSKMAGKAFHTITADDT